MRLNLNLGNILVFITGSQYRRVSAIAARHAISGEVARNWPTAMTTAPATAASEPPERSKPVIDHSLRYLTIT